MGLSGVRRTPSVLNGPEPVSGTELALEAPPVTAERAVVRRLQGEHVELRQSAVLGSLSKDAALNQSAGLFVSGAKVNLDRSATQWLVGGLVQAKQVFAVTVIAAKVEGQVRCLFDTKGAFAFGAGLAIVGTALRLLFRK
jgi:hypothetical protein